MTLIFLKPTTSSQRHLKKINKKQLRKQPIIKTKILGFKKFSGKNNSGKITVKHKGNGHKTRYRKIDFYRINKTIGIVISLEYDPNRNANIASVYDFTKNVFFYIIAPNNLNVGNIVKSGLEAELYTGNSLPFFRIPQGSFIHNISVNNKAKAKLTRAAGAFAILKEKTADYAKIKFSSGKEKLLSLQGYGTLGIVSNTSCFLAQLGKAGQSRWLNKRPKVRGVAMNPVDHPHGGGEGKKSGNGLSPWGKPSRKQVKKK